MADGTRSVPATLEDAMTLDPQRGLSQRAHLAGGDKLISRLMAEALARPDLVSLAAGFVDQATLPVEATQQATRRLVVRSPLVPGPHCNMAPRSATYHLREAILARMAAADGAGGPKGTVPFSTTRCAVPRENRDIPRRAPFDQVVITAGSNQLLHLVADTLLGPRRHRALRRAKLLRLHGHAWPTSARERWAWRSTPTA